jgi:hypothetical protein
MHASKHACMEMVDGIDGKGYVNTLLTFVSDPHIPKP